MKLLAGLLVGLAFAASACGGRNGGGPTTSNGAPAKSNGAPTKAGFILQADRICSSQQSEFDRLTKQLDAAQSDAEARAIEGKVYAAMARRRDQLRRLPAPAGDGAVLQRWFASLDVLVDSEGAVVKATDPRVSNAEVNRVNLQESNAQSAEAGIARRYGMTACG